MQNKRFRSGPIALTTTLTTNILNPPAASGGVNAGSSAQYLNLTEIQIANKTSAAATFSLWLGATGANAAGTELFVGVNIPANTTVPFYFPGLRLESTDFLVGGSNTATALSFVAMGEIGVAG